MRPEDRDHVWSYDFVHYHTDEGKAFRSLNSGNVIDVLSDLFILCGLRSFIRSDNGPEFVAQAVQDWIKAVGAQTADIEPDCPWESGDCESFNARFRGDFLSGKIFYSLREAQILIEEWSLS